MLDTLCENISIDSRFHVSMRLARPRTILLKYLNVTFYIQLRTRFYRFKSLNSHGWAGYRRYMQKIKISQYPFSLFDFIHIFVLGRAPGNMQPHIRLGAYGPRERVAHLQAQYLLHFPTVLVERTTKLAINFFFLFFFFFLIKKSDEDRSILRTKKKKKKN